MFCRKSMAMHHDSSSVTNINDLERRSNLERKKNIETKQIVKYAHLTHMHGFMQEISNAQTSEQ